MVGVHPTSSGRLRSQERGAADIFMIMLLGLLIAFAGLAYDMGMVFNARREAVNIAGAAARDAANQVDPDGLYQTGVAHYIDSEAEAAAAARVATHATAQLIDTDVSPDSDEITVHVQIEHETLLLGIIGFDSFTIVGESSARVQNGR